MAKLSNDEGWALDVLAHNFDGCTEATLLAGGFTIRQLTGLVIDGLATLERKSVNIGGRDKTVLWMRITETGREAIAA
jgi:hypothetical protein